MNPCGPGRTLRLFTAVDDYHAVTCSRFSVAGACLSPALMATAVFTASYHVKMSVLATRSENASHPSMALRTPYTDYKKRHSGHDAVIRNNITRQHQRTSIPTIFTQDALPYTTLPIYTGLGQAPNMLACIPSIHESVSKKQHICINYICMWENTTLQSALIGMFWSLSIMAYLLKTNSTGQTIRLLQGNRRQRSLLPLLPR